MQANIQSRWEVIKWIPSPILPFIRNLIGCTFYLRHILGSTNMQSILMNIHDLLLIYQNTDNYE